MSNAVSDAYLVEHYDTRSERTADHWVHLVAIGLSCVGAAWLVTLTIQKNHPGQIIAAVLYGIALIGMLTFSALYNLGPISPSRSFLRRLDEAGIFLMIAGSYTPFTTHHLDGRWAIGMTGLVWLGALGGICAKLTFTRLSERSWTIIYALFAWIVALAFRPMIRSLPLTAVALLIAGGLVYTCGIPVFLGTKIPFRRAVWHGFVCAGAGLHYLAILAGTLPDALHS